MKFVDLMYCGKVIKVVVDLDDSFIENNNEIKDYDDSDTLDLTNIRLDLHTEKGDSNGE